MKTVMANVKTLTSDGTALTFQVKVSKSAVAVKALLDSKAAVYVGQVIECDEEMALYSGVNI